MQYLVSDHVSLGNKGRTVCILITSVEDKAEAVQRFTELFGESFAGTVEHFTQETFWSKYHMHAPTYYINPMIDDVEFNYHSKMTTNWR